MISKGDVSFDLEVFSTGRDGRFYVRREPDATSSGAHFLRMAQGERARIAQRRLLISIDLMVFPMALALRCIGMYQADIVQVIVRAKQKLTTQRLESLR